MRSYERNGVTIEQCTECRGIFLDRGELERLTAAEQAWHSPPPQQHQPHQTHQPHPQQHGYSYGYHPHKKKHKSLFEELFD